MYFGLLYIIYMVNMKVFANRFSDFRYEQFLGGWGGGGEHLKQCDHVGHHFSDGVGHVVNVMVQFVMRLVVYCNDAICGGAGRFAMIRVYDFSYASAATFSSFVVLVNTNFS